MRAVLFAAIVSIASATAWDAAMGCSSPQQTIRTALPVARAIVDLAEAVCVATDSAEKCLTKCQIEQQRRSAEAVIQEATKP